MKNMFRMNSVAAALVSVVLVTMTGCHAFKCSFSYEIDKGVSASGDVSLLWESRETPFDSSEWLSIKLKRPDGSTENIKVDCDVPREAMRLETSENSSVVKVVRRANGKVVFECDPE